MKIKILEKAEILKGLDEEIFDILIEDADEEDCEQDLEEASEIQENVNYYLIKLTMALKDAEGMSEKEEVESTQILSRASSHKSLCSKASTFSDIVTEIRGRRIKLPKLELKKFGGRISDGQEFWDGYKSAVHDDPELAKVDKFKYLRSYLEEPARSVVTGFALTEADYDAAIELLKARYAKPSVIKRAHINDLLNLNPVFHEKNVTRLRNLHDQIETRYRAMETQAIEKNSYSSVVVPVLMGKIPEALRNNMIRFGSNHMEWNLDDFLTALGKELDVLEEHFPIMPVYQPSKKPEQGNYNRPKFQERPPTASALFAAKDAKRRCVFCTEDYPSDEFEKIKDPEELKSVLLKTARCFSCLRSGHRSFKCQFKVNCSMCSKGNHHRAICPMLAPSKEALLKPTATAPPASQLDASTSAWVGNTGSGERVALQTALAMVDGKRECVVRVLFDTGSQKSFITAKAASRLGLRPERSEELTIKSFGSKGGNVAAREVVKLDLSSLQGEEGNKVEAFIVGNISDLPNIHAEIVKRKFLHLKDLWFSDVCRNEDTLEIDCLIGSDWLWQFGSGQTIRGGPGEPIAVKTSLGWVLSGPLPGKPIDSIECNVNYCREATPTFDDKCSISEYAYRLWDLDSIGIREVVSVHENTLDNILFTGKRYSVGLPWKLGHNPLPSNYSISLQRLKSQVKKLQQNPQMYEQYDEINTQQNKEGIIEEVTELETERKVHYLPHRAVVRESVETTKIRVVYDASYKARKSGVSLNDCLHVGPSLTPMIFDLLMRFRMNHIALVGDIEKAFLNIKIHEEDRDYLRFLWLRDIHASNPEVVTYRFNRVVFGCNSSPFLLSCVLRHHINTFEEDPEFLEKMTGSFYVDDLVTGSEGVEKAFGLYEKSKDRMKKGGFHLRKWKTNSFDLTKEISSRESSVIGLSSHQEDTSEAKESLGISTPIEESTKVLGIKWKLVDDILEFDLKERRDTICKSLQATKRGILSALASLYDPHGLVSPVAISAKILFQELCKEKLGWDDELPEQSYVRWMAWLEDLQETGTITVPRCVLTKDHGKHRVNEILSLSKKESWSHVAGVDNPADLGSRGVTAIELKNSRLWWKGPPWLREDIKFWPKPMLIDDSDEIREEQRKCQVTAYVKRFIDNLRSRRSREPRSLGALGIQELEAAERFDGKAFTPHPTSDLPDFRVTETLPFSNVGVDFAGPLYVKEGAEMSKTYVALFTCCVTRAGHLELVPNLQTATFVNCLRRFCTQRGTPNLINSDNAQTIKAAHNLLKKLTTDYSLQEFTEQHRISWKFNLSLSPWWGGYYERMVWSVKRCLRKVLGNARLSFDELNTVLAEIESTLNARPLTYSYDELGEALTPSHLILGHRFPLISEGITTVDDSDDDDHLMKRFVYLTKKLAHYWNRWRNEYLTDLREFHRLKNNGKATVVKKGDVVLVAEDNAKRGQWKIAIVDEVMLGKDGEPRGAKINKVGRGKLESINRPIQKLYPLEINFVDETRKGMECESDRRQSSRAAAKDARWKSKLMLDH
eukprot:gene19302-biopygen16181